MIKHIYKVKNYTLLMRLFIITIGIFLCLNNLKAQVVSTHPTYQQFKFEFSNMNSIPMPVYRNYFGPYSYKVPNVFNIGFTNVRFGTYNREIIRYERTR